MFRGISRVASSLCTKAQILERPDPGYYAQGLQIASRFSQHPHQSP